MLTIALDVSAVADILNGEAESFSVAAVPKLERQISSAGNPEIDGISGASLISFAVRKIIPIYG